MSGVREACDGVIYGVFALDPQRMLAVRSCIGELQQNHQTFLAKALRGETAEIAADARYIEQLAEWISTGWRLRTVVLQGGVARGDLEFFLGYWATQFPDLGYYPDEAQKPDTITDAGLSILHSISNKD